MPSTPTAMSERQRQVALLDLFADDLEDIRVNYDGKIGTQTVERARALARVLEKYLDELHTYVGVI